ncbi:MAG: restriction endonuclease [Elusimicrobia bacterium]|nr:restriction endonuclease [Elusimicrobiota bacterium]
MAVPDFQSFFKPLLELASDGQEHSVREARATIAKTMALSDQDMAEVLPSGTQTKFDNRVAWAKSYFIQAKVFEPTRRGHFKITDRGRELLSKGLSRIDIRVLDQYSEFVEFHSASRESDAPSSPDVVPVPAETPEEVLQKAHQSIRNELAAELLSRVKTNSPNFFESLVVDLMIAMGYGGSRADAGKAIGQTGDEGIDGIIKEDRLGLDIIYLQAKRWDGTVGRPEIQRFVGALHGKRAKKGVFITTGRFSDDAIDYVGTIDPKVILIDGRNLSNLMIDFNLGTTTAANYEVKRIDSDYFGED